MARIQKQSKINSPKILSFSSGKGGVGKTSITVNVATALAQHNRKVLLVDGDLGLANVDIVLGLSVKRTMRESLEEGAALKDILVKVSPNFTVLPASSGVPEMASLSFEEQSFLTTELAQIIDEFDYVLVDTAAGIGESVLWLNEWAPNNIIILTPDPTSMTDAYALMKVLASQYGKRNFHLIINNIKSKKEGDDVFQGMAAVLRKFLALEPVFFGAIPQDAHVVNAVRTQKPFFLHAPDCRASKAVLSIALVIDAMGQKSVPS